MEYQVVQGKRKVYILGAGFATRDEAMKHLLKRQLEGKRGLRIQKLIPYGADNRFKQVVDLR